MSKRKALTEAAVLAVVNSGNVYSINPLAYRSVAKLKVLERMRKEGKLAIKRIAPDHHEYSKP